MAKIQINLISIIILIPAILPAQNLAQSTCFFFAKLLISTKIDFHLIEAKKRRRECER